MRAQEQTVLNLIGGLDKVFIIPPFQRNYEWTREQCEELFGDIKTAYNTGKNHYLGNVVYFVGKNSGASYNEYILIDGQQRVTTILLLLCAIRDIIDDEDVVKSINARYLKNDTGDNRFRVRLKQTSYDSESFISIIDKTPCDNENCNVIKNYKLFKKLIRESESEVSPKDLYNTIPKLEIVDVNLQIENDLGAVQTIFEKINSTGKRLSPADLIRNFLLLSETAEEQERLYKNYWVKIEQTVKNENISRFARDYLIINTFDDVPNEKIYKMFKSHFTEAKASHISILTDMYEYSKYYSWLLFETCPNKKLNKLISKAIALKSEDVYSLYLYCFRSLYEENVEELIKIIKLLTDFMLRYRIVAPSGGGGALRSVVHQILDKISSEEISITYNAIHFELSNSSAISGRFPDDEEFAETLMTFVNPQYARVLLLQIEEFETKNVALPLRDVTVEHLMPQKLTDWWKQNLGGEEQASKTHEKYLNCIGNLTPMSAGYNSTNSNRAWHDKLPQIKSVQFAITSEIGKFQTWTEDEITQRNKDISKRACAATISPLPRTKLIQQRSISAEFVPGLYPISDISTPMNNADITEILFDDKVIKVSTWKEFLKKICEIAYDFDKTLFEKIVFENSIHKATSTKNYPSKDPIITRDKNLLVTAKEIDNTPYFVEGTISSARARFYAKQLLDIYEITDAFQINVSN